MDDRTNRCLLKTGVIFCSYLYLCRTIVVGGGVVLVELYSHGGIVVALAYRWPIALFFSLSGVSLSQIPRL